ncbi:hypothetical protein BK666_11695 [Pseudomonas frederiksbergensis]|uniref:Peptidase M16 C-terminal domain-containing protein n=1 Tax=Pseudomonas frederiksbergensis TaxID=104087 RepID=A0A423K751_9PSED|nr:insulinase family protein [Pseudomonas frederiksbergensis]RON47492.1 hypothetical protein BK666_11695 [Pseudomonas frederiksbergensis]
MNATTNTPTTNEFTLDNGLKVVVRENHHKAEFCSAITYGAGVYYETPEEWGLSSIVTQSLVKMEDYELVKELGGDLLSHWSQDSLTHRIILPRDHLETAFKLQSAMMMHAAQDEVFQRLHEVELLNSKKESTFVSCVSFSPKLEALIETGTRYYMTSEGLTHSLEQLTLEKIRQWHATWYVPSNAVLVVSGDITLDEIRQLAEEHFGPIAKSDAPQIDVSPTLPVPGYRQLTEQLDTQLPLMQVVFNVPGLATVTDVQSARALQVMTSLLTSAAPERLVTPDLNPSCMFSTYPRNCRGDSRITFAFYFEGDAHVAEAGFWAWLEEVKSTLLTAEEIEPAVKAASAKAQNRNKSNLRQSELIGQLIAIGCPWQLLDLELAQLESVTPADIQSTAQAFLTRERATVGHVFPMEK